MTLLGVPKRPEWYVDWSGETAVIVASGPSAVFQNIDIGIGRAKYIAINRSINLCPWAEVWYCCDFQWWEQYYRDEEFRREVGEFNGPLKVCVDYRIKDYPKWGVKFLYCDKQDDSIVFQPGRVGWGGNSGFNCLNMVTHFNPAKILLVGFDMTKNNGAHWHDPHPGSLSNPSRHSIERWRRVMENAAKPLHDAGIVVINCSRESALRKFPKMTFADALAYDGPPFLSKPGPPIEIPVTPAMAAERFAEAKAQLGDVIRRNVAAGAAPISENTVNYIAHRLAERM